MSTLKKVKRSWLRYIATFVMLTLGVMSALSATTMNAPLEDMPLGQWEEGDSSVDDLEGVVEGRRGAFLSTSGAFTLSAGGGSRSGNSEQEEF